MSIISNAVFSPEVINVGGELMTVFLIVTLASLLFLIDTKYWNKHILGIINISFNSLLLVFLLIIIFKVVLTI